MGKISIDYLFTEKRGIKPTREWAQLIRDNKDKYEKCRVVSFTRVKDLNSKWKHEYVQFIVEEKDTQERVRIYAERGNETDLDWVTFGPAETPTTGSKGKADLPLPLTSLVFGGTPDSNTSDKRPTVLDIAEILAAATTVGGPYKLYGHSCFWYAFTTYDAMRLNFGKLAQEKAWRWFDIGGAGGAGAKDAVGLGWTSLFKFYYVSDANKFKKERETRMEFLDGESREVVGSSYFVDRVASNMSNDEHRAIYISTMRDLGIDFTASEVEELLRNSKEEANHQAATDANWTKEFDNEVNDMVKTATSDVEADEALQKYTQYEAESVSELRNFVRLPLEADMNGEVEDTISGLKIIVGKILLVRDQTTAEV